MSDETLDGQPGAPAEPIEPERTWSRIAAGRSRSPRSPPGAGRPGRGAGRGRAPAAPKDLGLLKEVLEALVFVHRGILPPKTVREVLGEEFTAEEIAAGFAALRQDYEERGGALVLVEVAGGYQFGTRTDLAPWIKKLDFYEHHRHLSRPTMETLAIIAYKQPVTRAEIEAIRGVNVERIVRNLLERKLVRILGHKDVPGKPMVRRHHEGIPRAVRPEQPGRPAAAQGLRGAALRGGDRRGAAPAALRRGTRGPGTAPGATDDTSRGGGRDDRTGDGAWTRARSG